jgi:hypothetical protein
MAPPFLPPGAGMMLDDAAAAKQSYETLDTGCWHFWQKKK